MKRAGKLVVAVFCSLPVLAVTQEGNWYKTEQKCELWSFSPAQVSWTGSCPQGRASGYGSAMWVFVLDGHKSNEHYEGEMLDGRPDGDGVYRYRNGDQYRGHFIAGRREGRGRYVWSTGETFDGPFVDGRKQGTGVCTTTGGKQWQCSFDRGDLVGW